MVNGVDMAKSTSEQILDAAEKLFSQTGYHATTLRNITQEAKVNLAAVNYHFGSKEELVNAVIERRIVPINNIRMKMLNEIEKKTETQNYQPDTSEILKALIEGPLKFRAKEKRAKYCITLIGRAFSETDTTVRDIFLKKMSKVINKVVELLTLALPHIPIDIIKLRLSFSIGAFSHVMHTMDTNQQDTVLRGYKQSTEELVTLLVNYAKAGMEAPVK